MYNLSAGKESFVSGDIPGYGRAVTSGYPRRLSAPGRRSPLKEHLIQINRFKFFPSFCEMMRQGQRLGRQGQRLRRQGQRLGRQGQRLGRRGQRLGRRGQRLGRRGRRLGRRGQRLGRRGQRLGRQGQRLGRQGQRLGRQGQPPRANENEMRQLFPLLLLDRL